MLLHITYHDGSNPFVSMGDLAPEKCFKLYLRKAREYARISAAAAPSLFDGDPAQHWARNLSACADVTFYSGPYESGPHLAVTNIPGEPVLWAAYIDGRPVGAHYTTPGRAWAALQRRLTASRTAV